MLDQIKTSTTQQVERDSLGGGFTLDSALYDFTIKMAYVSKSPAGAYAVNLELATDDGKTLKSTQYITNQNGQTFYLDKDKKEVNLPGFNLINNLCLLAAKKEFMQLTQENKIVSVYNSDPDVKAMENKSVPVIVDLLGQRITAGVLRQEVDKTAKSGNKLPNGKDEYVATGETKEINEIDKFFRAKDGFTVAEILAQATESSFKQMWADKFTGVVQKKAKGAPAGKTPGAAGNAAPGQAAPAKSLFDE